MAYEGCGEQLGAPCVNHTIHQKMLSMLPRCLQLIEQCNAWPTDQNDACADAHPYCTEMVYLYRVTGLNTYDIRKPCIGDELCYPSGNMIGFLKRADVISALGAKSDIVWQECNMDVYAMFARDYHRNFNYTVPPLLAAGIRVMIYAGDMDYVCNWRGNKAWVTALNWPGKAAFNAASDVEFRVGGRAAGQERKYGNFSFVRVYDAGHMVPMDQPAAALYLLKQFLRK
ncbi:serine carboxypeptidase (CBP1) putativeserine peptidase Clan SC Family S10 [Leptomonas pyrrhocoris]|uniref:Serine carboxypeptidase (CBP1) putativeserine peptidase Clan SC Family S10 n=1 Tax=Leptomonas pyrrhocoris TaxID=157538 RepID=A0A0N0VEI7_LEPPY|nr:serine carboxypeptidase (CBP1) putativeserine peptidase Clan SC Family S10 [Leptomonas pyrrhocoris]KPA78501.1 serine carboxypeptidase (CBP1) putativeserine peptidase Clan SC Family S10 [Leptomonas pyrrhocoris]|eukprot:XP_015656940.1 serine carboxypeptidase (CBP1) putativeserine peptidase Clan SC Family S10 [Leptomonas pyrrhocoris]